MKVMRWCAASFSPEELRPGTYLTPGKGVMALLDSDTLHVQVYFEETKLVLQSALRSNPNHVQNRQAPHSASHAERYGPHSDPRLRATEAWSILNGSSISCCGFANVRSG
jgi:hypothetical protein